MLLLTIADTTIITLHTLLSSPLCFTSPPSSSSSAAPAGVATVLQLVLGVGDDKLWQALAGVVDDVDEAKKEAVKKWVNEEEADMEVDSTNTVRGTLR
jgi:hypothetical protein